MSGTAHVKLNRAKSAEAAQRCLPVSRSEFFFLSPQTCLPDDRDISAPR